MSSSRVDLVLVTALDEELEYVHEVLDVDATRAGDAPLDGGLLNAYLFNVKTKLGNTMSYRILTGARAKMTAGPMGSFATSLFKEYRPTIAALLGIAGAVNRGIAVGTIGISDNVVEYGNISVKGVDGEDQIQVRPTGYAGAEVMRNALRAIRTDKQRYEKWKTDCRTGYDKGAIGEAPHLVLGKYAAGPVVIKSADFRDALPGKVDPKIDFAEMEGGGFMEAGTLCGVPAIVVKGISDAADHTKETFDRAGAGVWRRFATTSGTKAMLAALRGRPIESVLTNQLILEVGRPESRVAREMGVEVDAPGPTVLGLENVLKFQGPAVHIALAVVCEANGAQVTPEHLRARATDRLGQSVPLGSSEMRSGFMIDKLGPCSIDVAIGSSRPLTRVTFSVSGPFIQDRTEVWSREPRKETGSGSSQPSQ